MDELLRSELKELKRFFVEHNWTNGLIPILFLLEDVKPGIYFLFIKERIN